MFFVRMMIFFFCRDWNCFKKVLKFLFEIVGFCLLILVLLLVFSFILIWVFFFILEKVVFRFFFCKNVLIYFLVNFLMNLSVLDGIWCFFSSFDMLMFLFSGYFVLYVEWFRFFIVKFLM